MTVAVDFLKQLVQNRTYAEVTPAGVKESRTETINRCADMHVRKFPHLETEIRDAFRWVHAGKVVGSMRSFQFGGVGIERDNARIFNCAYAAITTWRDFSDLFYLLMCGTGTGYSVQRHHIATLPQVEYEKGVGEVFIVEDTKEGWCDSVLKVLQNPSTELDVHKVRRKGAPLSTGGTASGPEALLKSVSEIRAILRRADGRKLRPIECHDIMCHIADGVVVGGVRRAALIALFDANDNEMLTCKHGLWWETNPQRARANNSAVLLRDDAVFKQTLERVLGMTIASNCGEPGILLSNNKDLGTNPCCEISLKSRQLCNLSEVNVSACEDHADFLGAVEAATIIGTIQATYTDFKYIHDDWKVNVEDEALLGVSLTGQAEKWPELQEWLSDEHHTALTIRTNREWAAKLDINSSARINTVKPSGSTSAWLGTTSGIHAAHAKYFIRRVRVGTDDPIAKLLEGTAFSEPDKFNEANVVVSIPIATPDAITRQSETALELLERAKFVYQNWVRNGHVSGDNTHNVSLTVSYKPEETDEVVKWMVDNSDSWAGISLLPYDGGSYTQAPFEEISEDVYRVLVAAFDLPGLDSADYSGTQDGRIGELACSGPMGCEIT